MTLVKLQGAEGLDWDEACLHASRLMDVSGKRYRDEIRAEANRVYKKRFMTEINKAKQTWIKKGFQEGVNESRITYPCSVCGGELVMKPEAVDHDAMKLLMKEKGWAHSTCLKQCARAASTL